MNVGRRNALLASVAGATAIVAAGNTAVGQGEGGTKERALGDNPRGWGGRGDQSFRVTEGREPFQNGTRGNNCDEKKEDIEGRFDVVKFGSCKHPTPVDADVVAAELIGEVILEGGVFNTEFGHKTVKNTSGPISYNTYLSYAAGDRSP